MLRALLRRKAAVAEMGLWRGGIGEGLRRQVAAGACEVDGKKRTEDMVAEAERQTRRRRAARRRPPRPWVGVGGRDKPLPSGGEGGRLEGSSELLFDFSLNQPFENGNLVKETEEI